MDNALSKRLAKIVCDGLQEMSEDFADEIGRSPTIDELCEILTYGIQSSREDLLEGVRAQDVVSLKPTLKKDGNRKVRKKKAQTSAVDELNDNVFVLANGLWTDLAHAFTGETGKRPDLKTLCQVITDALHGCDTNLLSDVQSEKVLAIEPKVRKAPKASTRVGDIVAIPAQNGQHFIAVVVDKNDFGTAYGVFKGARPAEPVSASDHPPVVRHPIYSGDTLVEKGQWPIVGHDEALLALFPGEPEVFHRAQSVPDGREMGPNGSAESPSGKWRDLSHAEAEEVGLLDHTYSEFYLPEHLGSYLSERYS